jgi:hypothetical protein
MTLRLGDPVGRSRSVVLSLAVIGCSNAGAGPVAPSANHPGSAADLRVVNATAHPFAFFVIAADLAPLLDPLPEVAVGDPDTQVVLPGAEYVLGNVPRLAEAPKGGVAVYLYAFIPDGHRARFTQVQLVSGTVIRQAGGRIVIHRIQP